MSLTKSLKLKSSRQKALIALFVFVPFHAFASVEITEIMYDLEGSDSGREWIEIHNTGSEAIDITNWKFFEEGSNHSFTEYQGGSLLGAGEYAVIVSTPDKFLADWPGFSGMIIDSSWSSFKNTGELLAIRDETLTDIDAVTYDPNIGGAGDGNSLQKSGGVFLAAAPTPGEAFAASSSAEDSGTALQGGSSDTNDSFPINLKVSIGKNKKVFVGADNVYEALVVGNEDIALEKARVIWTFGNGEQKEGEKVTHHYSYPGKYIVRSVAASGKYTAIDQVIVEAIPAEVYITDASEKFIKIKNASSENLDLGRWYLEAGGKLFQFPEGTFTLAKTETVFPANITLLTPKDASEVILLYPNLQVVTTIGVKSEVADEPAVAEKNLNVSTMIISSQTVEEIKDNSSQPIAGEQNLLQVATVSEGGEKNLFPWVMGLCSIIGIGVVSVFFLGRKEEENEASQFNIKEIE